VSLDRRAAHVWRIRISRNDHRALWSVLSPDERERARRFMLERDAQAYVIAHGLLRRILARYDVGSPHELCFVAGEFGKPALVTEPGVPSLEFNLAHAGDLALVVVSRAGPVGADVEQWNREIDHQELAERYFSPVEQAALRRLAADREATTEGFFNAWTRKEAYLKATGHGITRGLHYFDVSLTPGEPAALIADRLDPSAVDRWRMAALDLDDDYAAAIVVPKGVSEILHHDAD
jgi:4'-phosphopantetheinyl transferase